jgi:phosphatidylserine decarboxylase
VNEWFIRPLAPGWRFVASPNDHSVVVQPCDARVMLFPRMPSDSFVWIKDTAYTVEGLIGSAAYAMAQDSFDQGSMALVRLAPQDYHQFHAPVTGTVLSVYTIEGTFHSVNADGMTSGNYAVYNQRKVMLLDTTGYANIGRVAYVAIGALCVGSITFLPSVGSLVTKGSSVGYFQFGGSTVAIVFERNTVQFEQDIVEHSAMRIETLVQVGSRMATTL